MIWIKNSTTEPQRTIPNLGTISEEYIMKYIKMFDKSKSL